LCICWLYILNILETVYNLLVFIIIYYSFKIVGSTDSTVLYTLKYHHVLAAEHNQLQQSYSAHAPISFIFSLSARGAPESVRVKFHEYWWDVYFLTCGFISFIMRQGLLEKCDKIPIEMPVNCVCYWEPMTMKNYICQ
jgi:hypothetical protein